jgi:hypothetical protein
MVAKPLRRILRRHDVPQLLVCRHRTLMSISQRYLDLLAHFGHTEHVHALQLEPGASNLIALRHDVDHDLNVALEMAHAEHRVGARSTYFLLHSNAYCQQPHFLERCLQLQDYGHEIGIHVNGLTEWIEGKVDDPAEPIARLADRLRSVGIAPVGVAAHGDKRCYQHGYSNTWIWSENRGATPAKSEAGMSAEGILVQDPRWQIPYPSGERLRRADGREFPLWSRSLAELGLGYEACRLHHDRYWSDSGGAWQRTPDPITADLSHQRHQVLVHPEWWVAENPTIAFVCGDVKPELLVLLAALARLASAATVLEDWTLHWCRTVSDRGYERISMRKDGATPQPKPTRASLFKQAIRHHLNLKRDVIEFNQSLRSAARSLATELPTSEFAALIEKENAVVLKITGPRPTVTSKLRDPLAIFLELLRTLNIVVHPRLLGVAIRELFHNGHGQAEYVPSAGHAQRTMLS